MINNSLVLRSMISFFEVASLRVIVVAFQGLYAAHCGNKVVQAIAKSP